MTLGKQRKRSKGVAHNRPRVKAQISDDIPVTQYQFQ
jgi:hypothetical protein